jgi:hypothetical protein
VEGDSRGNGVAFTLKEGNSGVGLMTELASLLSG